MSLLPLPEKSLVIPSDPVWRLSVAQYHQMIQSGIVTDDDPVELLEGWLITKTPKNRPHSLSTQLTREALAKLIPSGWFVDAREPITMINSEPEPDIVVVRGERREYTDRHPYPEEVALVVEVANTTLQRDRSLKRRLYASAPIAIYWILNLQEMLLEVYTEPSGRGDAADYQQQQNYHAGDRVPVWIDQRQIGSIAVSDLLPRHDEA